MLVKLDGYEGPMDLLLDLAKTQHVDIARISVLSLAEQFLSAVEDARRVSLELAADWLVMAAWLTWLKSRLMVPDGGETDEEAVAAAGDLASRLRDLEMAKAAALWMSTHPQTGWDCMTKGESENLTEIDRSGIVADTASLVHAYIAAMSRAAKRRPYRPKPISYWTVRDALARMSRMIGALPDGSDILDYLPERGADNPALRRAALSSTLIASLDLAKAGTIILRQEEAFGPILVNRADRTP